MKLKKYFLVGGLGLLSIALFVVNVKLTYDIGKLRGENENLKDLNRGQQRSLERSYFAQGKLDRMLTEK